MKEIKTEDAVGHILCHDMTRIVKGETKGPAFRKGHVVQPEDIPLLLSMGKEHLYVWETSESMMHEDEAAGVLFKMCNGDNTEGSAPKEGKIDVFSTCDGLLQVDVTRLNQINSFGDMMIATRRNNMPVRKGDHIAGTRVIPLVIDKDKMNEASRLSGDDPLLSIKPFSKKKVGIVVTGSEVEKGLIQDTFSDVLVEKLAEYDSEVIAKELAGDESSRITQTILGMIDDGVDMVLCTGGMSVDPDDKTPLAIKNTGANIVSYGAPVLPGAMFLLAYTDKKVPILGLPGCVMYSKKTIFDIVLPRLLADVDITPDDLHVLGNGGLCLNCDICVFPICSFGIGA